MFKQIIKNIKINLETPKEKEARVLKHLKTFLIYEGWELTSHHIVSLGAYKKHAGVYTDGVIFMDPRLSLYGKIRVYIHEQRHHYQFTQTDAAEREIFITAQAELQFGHVSYEEAYHEVDARNYEEIFYKKFVEYCKINKIKGLKNV